MSTSTSELPVDAAYEAARARALRTTDALILAEGQVRDLERQLAEVTAQRDQYAKDAVTLHELRRVRRMRDRARRERRRAEAEGVSDAAAESDPVGYTGAVGQAD